MSRSFHITTFGCQMNQADTEMMSGIMSARGWTPAESEESADVILYNTCVVREHAEQRAVGRLSQLRSLKAARPSLIIGVTGCMAQKEADNLHALLPHVDLVLGTRAIPRLAPLLDRVISTGEAQTCVDVLDDAFPADLVPARKRSIKGLINIILGCNKNCSYCIVPRTRGREQSRPAEEIVAEARGMSREGFGDITLVGQNVNSYADPQGTGFGELLRRVGAATGESWIRYITSHPRDCNEAHISAVAETPNVCENFHLPVQSGSTRVLRKMYRGYSRERYLRLVDRVRAAVPEAVLTTDIIVGFPGETDQEFRETMSLVEEVRFDSAYMYMYSPRSGTPAAEKFEDHIPLEVKKARLAELIERQERISAEINAGLVGATFEARIEGIAPRTPGDLLASTRGDKKVILPGPPEWIGRVLDVRVRESNGHTLLANPVAPENQEYAAAEAGYGHAHTGDESV